MSDRRTSLLATGVLLLMTASWGSTFFLIKDLLDRVPVLDFLAVRFAIAGVAMVLVAPRALARLSPASRRQAMVLGALYGLAQILQTAGLAHTAASVSGFITGMYVVLTPVLAALLLRTRITAMTWAAVALATAGLGVLTLQGFSIGYGEAITLVSAVLYALHIVGLGAWSTTGEALGMSIVQLLVIAVICLVATAPDGVVLPDQMLSGPIFIPMCCKVCRSLSKYLGNPFILNYLRKKQHYKPFWKSRVDNPGREVC